MKSYGLIELLLKASIAIPDTSIFNAIHMLSCAFGEALQDGSVEPGYTRFQCILRISCDLIIAVFLPENLSILTGFQSLDL